MNTDERERLKQIRERHRLAVFAYKGEKPPIAVGDIDFLLSLLDSEAALDCRPNMIAINREHAAVLMRDKCVEKVREYGEFHLAEMKYQSRAGQEDEANAHASRSVAADELAAQLKSLTLDQGRAGA